MKRILRKGNPIARLVALWVVFVMVLVPLLENAGPLKKVKAESKDLSYTANVELGSVNVSMEEEALNPGPGKKVTYKINSKYASVPSEADVPLLRYYMRNSDSLGVLTINSNLSVDPTYNSSMLSYEQMVVASADLNFFVVEADTLASSSTVTEGQYFGIYIRIKDTSLEVSGSGDTYSYPWTLQAIYKVKRDYSIITSSDNNKVWVNGEGTALDETSGNKVVYVANSHYNNTLTSDDEYIGKVKFQYAKYNNSSVTYSTYKNYDASSPYALHDINSGECLDSSNADGVYVIWSLYDLGDGNGFIVSNSNGRKVLLDNKAPELDGSMFLYDSGMNLQTAVGNVYYLDSAETYNVQFGIKNTEASSANTMSVRAVNVADVSDVVESTPDAERYNTSYRYDIDDLANGLHEGKTYDIVVSLKDKAGNSEDKTLGAVCKVNKDLSVTPSITKLEMTTRDTQNITLNITSGEKPERVYVYGVPEGKTVAEKQLLTEIPITFADDYEKAYGGLIYEYSCPITLPIDQSITSVKYEDIELVVKDQHPDGSNEWKLNLGYLYFDKEAPQVMSSVMKIDDANSSNRLLTSSMSVDNIVYVDEALNVNDNLPYIELGLKEDNMPNKLNIIVKNGNANVSILEVSPVGTNNKIDLKDVDFETNKVYSIYIQVLEDSLGNQNNYGNEVGLGSFKIQDKDLRIVSATLSDGSPAWDVSNVIAPDKAFKNSPSNKIHTFKLEIQSGYPFAQESVVIKDKNGNTLDGGIFDLRQVEAVDGIYGAEITYNFPTPSNNDVKLEGIYVEIKDTNPDATKNTKTIELGDFTYDKTAPDLVALGIYKANANGTYTEIKNKDLSNGEYIVDTTLDETFVIVYGAKDATTSVVEYDYFFTNSEASKIDQLKVPAVDSKLNDISNEYDEYYIEYNTADLVQLITSNNTNKVTFYAKVVDEATNPTELVPATYTMVIPDNGLTVTATLTDQNGNVIDLSKINDGSYIANKKLELHVKAISGYDITTMELLTDSTVYSTTSVTSKYDINNKKYTVEQTLAIPTDISSNQLLKSIQLRVTDTGNPAKTISVGQLLFDMSAPTITYADGSALAEDSTWYQSYNLAIAIKAGAQSVESEIDNVKYSISNSYGDKTDATDGVNYSGAAANINIDLPESYTAAGTKINVSVTDKATNSNTAAASIRVDKTNPVVDELTVNGNPYNSIPLSSSVVVKTTASDNLALAKVSMVVESEDGTKRYPKDFEYDTMAAVSDDGSRVIRNEELSLSDLADGKYNVTVTAYDKSGRVSSVKTTSFSVDSTKPVVTVKIAEGTKGGKQSSTNFDGTARDYYYSSNVGLELTYTEINLDEVVVTDNGSKVSLDWTYDSATGKHVASYKSTSEGLHQVIISAKDKTGNEAESKTIYFVKDTSAPTISAIVNGAINYTDSTGSLIFTNDSTVAYSVSDANEDKGDFNYQLIKNVPDEPVSTGDYVKTAVRTFTYTEEADYTINVFSIDMASNKSATKTVSFRLDKTAPNISIGGIGDGGSSSTPVTVSLNMQELFWSDATGTVEIYMKSGEGFGEELIEEITYTPTGRNTAISRTFSESGIYRIVFNAQDNAGHTANAESAFTIDTEVPVVTLEGVSNFDVTDKDVVITSTITEKFYASKKVTITGSVTDDTGKVTPITIDDYSPTANPTVINHTFSDDGIYDLTISCVDIVGNTDSKTVHFTIDKSNPVIGDLSDYDGKTLTSFEWDKDLDELVSDLTVCDVHMYLNGQEYNGEDAVEDGSYVLLITAEDELGHKTEKSVEFVLDTKAPVFIVTGVEDKEKKLEPYNISVSLQLEEDTLTSVTLNGKVVTITNNVATINVTEIGEYKLYMEAVDAAGNTSSAEYEFELISEKEFNFWIIIGIAALLLLIILFIILGKRKKDKE